MPYVKLALYHPILSDMAGGNVGPHLYHENKWLVFIDMKNWLNNATEWTMCNVTKMLDNKNGKTGMDKDKGGKPP